MSDLSRKLQLTRGQLGGIAAHAIQFMDYTRYSSKPTRLEEGRVSYERGLLLPKPTPAEGSLGEFEGHVVKPCSSPPTMPELGEERSERGE